MKSHLLAMDFFHLSIAWQNYYPTHVSNAGGSTNKVQAGQVYRLQCD